MISRLSLILFMSVCLLACASSPDQRKSGTIPDSAGVPPANSGAGNTSRATQVDSLPRLKALDTVLAFAGVWVNEIYFDSILKNRSPRLDQGIMKSCIVIPDSTLEATNMVGGFHDGAAAMVVVKIGNRYQFYNPELTHPRDTIEPLSPIRLRIGDQYFRRLQHPDTKKNDWGILEEILFSGKYRKENGEEVEFRADGQVTGLDIVSWYEPVIDYADRSDRYLNLINLGQSHTKLDEYAFRFDKDTLLIYTVDCLRYDAGAHECDSSRFGEFMWKLIKMPG